MEVSTAKWDTAIKAKWPTGIKVRPFHEKSGIDASGAPKSQLRGVKQHTGGARQSQQPFRHRRTTSNTGTLQHGRQGGASLHKRHYQANKPYQHKNWNRSSTNHRKANLWTENSNYPQSR